MSLEKFYNKHKDNKFINLIDAMTYRFIYHRVTTLASSSVYYFVLSIFPFLIAFVNIAAKINLHKYFSVPEIFNTLPVEIQSIFTDFISNIEATSTTSLLIISIILGLWPASRGIISLVININVAYSVTKRRNYFKASIISIFLTVAMIVLIVFLTMFTVFGQRLETLIYTYVNEYEAIRMFFEAVNSIFFPLVYMAVVFFLLYYLAPNLDNKKTVPIKLFLPGTVFSTLFVILASLLFSYYANNLSSYSVTYGSLASMAIFLVWLFLMNTIILLGGELNAYFYSKHYDMDLEHSYFETLIKGK